MKKHDRSFRLLFGQPRLMEDLIRRFIGRGESWVDDLDFSTLERVGTAHVSDDLESRDGDVGWRVTFRDAPVAIYVLVEFQSEPQRFMALRKSVYQGLFFQHLLKQGGLTPEGLLPLVLSIVVYNGKARWRAPQELAELIRGIDGPLAAFIPRFWYLLLEMEACEEADLQGHNLVALLIRLERGRSREELERIIGDLVAALPGPDEGGVRLWFGYGASSSPEEPKRRSQSWSTWRSLEPCYSNLSKSGTRRSKPAVKRRDFKGAWRKGAAVSFCISSKSSLEAWTTAPARRSRQRIRRM